MFKVPKFRLYGEGDPTIEASIQPQLRLRSWSDLDLAEKEIARQELENKEWLSEYSGEILSTISYLNHTFLQLCPGKKLHKTPRRKSSRREFDIDHDRTRAALADFQDILLNAESEALVLRMLSVFAQNYINDRDYKSAEKETEENKKRQYVEEAFKKFDRLANCFNHIFEQFSVNVVFTRNGLVPRQDDRITEDIYVPTLKALADPQWKNVSADLGDMFTQYRDGKYSETITSAHRAVQRFLQILVGEEGKSGKGEVGKLFSKAKNENLIPVDRFTEPLIQVFQSFISSERATKSTAKPAKDTATPADALLVMNVVMVFLQHCLCCSR